MVAGHLDEVGFMVTRIDDNGFIYFQTVGGWWSQVMLAHRVTIMSNDGDITVIIGFKLLHNLSFEDLIKLDYFKYIFYIISVWITKEDMIFFFTSVYAVVTH